MYSFFDLHEARQGYHTQSVDVCRDKHLSNCKLKPVRLRINRSGCYLHSNTPSLILKGFHSTSRCWHPWQ